MPGIERKNAFFTRIHLAHLPPQENIDCLTCHAWSLGKSFGLLDGKDSWGLPTEEDMNVTKEIFASWAESQ
jgi:hypothetical protein